MSNKHANKMLDAPVRLNRMRQCKNCLTFHADYLAGMRVLLFLGLALPLFCAAQDAPADSTESVNMAIVEEVPRWPGCAAESGTAAQACTDAGVMRHVVEQVSGKARRKGIRGGHRPFRG